MGTFTPLVHAHAGRTQSYQLYRFTLGSSQQIMAALCVKTRSHDETTNINLASYIFLTGVCHNVPK
jgi:hypothetical protein